MTYFWQKSGSATKSEQTLQKPNQPSECPVRYRVSIFCEKYRLKVLMSLSIGAGVDKTQERLVCIWRVGIWCHLMVSTSATVQTIYEAAICRICPDKGIIWYLAAVWQLSGDFLVVDWAGCLMWHVFGQTFSGCWLDVNRASCIAAQPRQIHCCRQGSCNREHYDTVFSSRLSSTVSTAERVTGRYIWTDRSHTQTRKTTRYALQWKQMRCCCWRCAKVSTYVTKGGRLAPTGNDLIDDIMARWWDVIVCFARRKQAIALRMPARSWLWKMFGWRPSDFSQTTPGFKLLFAVAFGSIRILRLREILHPFA